LTLGTRQLFANPTWINGGTLLLSGGDNRLFVSALGAGNVLNVNEGALDLGGNNQTVGSAQQLQRDAWVRVVL
jgi:hypothetical protein